MKLAKDAKGSAGSTVLPRVNGSVYLTDPKEDVDLGFLNGTTIAGSIGELSFSCSCFVSPKGTLSHSRGLTRIGSQVGSVPNRSSWRI